MGALRMLGWSELRRRWRSIVVLTVLVGFAGAVVLALVAGARRTDSAVARFETAQPSRPTVEIDAGDTTPAELAGVPPHSGRRRGRAAAPAHDGRRRRAVPRRPGHRSTTSSGGRSTGRE